MLRRVTKYFIDKNTGISAMYIFVRGEYESTTCQLYINIIYIAYIVHTSYNDDI